MSLQKGEEGVMEKEGFSYWGPGGGKNLVEGNAVGNRNNLTGDEEKIRTQGGRGGRGR